MESIGVKVLCIVPVRGDTKDSKRIKLLQEIGYLVTVGAFDRDYYKSRIPNAEIVILAKIENGKYIQRIFKYLTAFKKLRKLIKETDVIYTFSPDLAIISWFCNIFIRRPIIMDVADIRDIQVGNSIISIFYRKIEKYISVKMSFIVVTADEIGSWYYRNILKINVPLLTIENKVDYQINVNIDNVTKLNKINIGYFGVIRSEWSLNILNDLAKQSDKFNIYVAGICLLNNNVEIESFKYLKFLGAYKSPEDLQDLYSKVDMIWACYPDPYKDFTNIIMAQQVCRSNRFYEACYFKKPIISMISSSDSKSVDNYKIGLILKGYDAGECINELNNITSDDINTWRENMMNLDKSIYILNNEKNEIKKMFEKYTTN